MSVHWTEDSRLRGTVLRIILYNAYLLIVYLVKNSHLTNNQKYSCHVFLTNILFLPEYIFSYKFMIKKKKNTHVLKFNFNKSIFYYILIK